MAATLSNLNAKPSQAAASAAETLIVDELPSEATLRLKFDHLVTIIIALQTTPCTGSRDHPDENALRRLIRRAPNLQNLCIIQQIAPEDSEKASDRSLLGDRPGVNIKYIPAHDLAADMRDRVTVLGSEQCFPQGTAQTICTVIAVLMTSVAMSAIMSSLLSSEFGDEHPAKRDQSILAFSRGAAIIFLLLYFKSRTHSNLFCNETPPDETKDSIISIVAATAVLTITVALAVVCANNLVGSINPFAEVTHVGPDFIGFFLVLIAINAAKASAAVGKATRNRMDLAMDIILNSITETGLLVAPCLVILAWALFHESMTLQFELVPTVTYVFATLAAAVVVRDGRSKYLEGALLLGFYVIIGLAVFFGPVDG
ncbi:unnamed protein product [Colletotrichum noveboracense]|uniref:Sodium/calcium exchanger membrane region domain-containing protein n=1 Tax=Colletotrichum noveboracense TaxID=2664923 RepID=A0A9W4WH36_9PEZI|nr:unnamed protein product [Colletotrichum noveboracense]